MKGKIKITISSSLAILLIVAIVIICVFFAPRALRNDVANQGAIRNIPQMGLCIKPKI